MINSKLNKIIYALGMQKNADKKERKVFYAEEFLMRLQMLSKENILISSG